MLLAVRISSYGCTWEIWKALKKLEQLLRFSRALQASRVHRKLDTRTLSMNQFLNLRMILQKSSFLCSQRNWKHSYLALVFIRYCSFSFFVISDFSGRHNRRARAWWLSDSCDARQHLQICQVMNQYEISYFYALKRARWLIQVGSSELNNTHTQRPDTPSGKCVRTFHWPTDGTMFKRMMTSGHLDTWRLRILRVY